MCYNIIIEYFAALKKGSVPSACVRVMFLGAGGSGKSSLLDGLMGQCLREAESTVLADTQTVSFQWISTTERAKSIWKPYSDREETRNLAAKTDIIVQSGDHSGVPAATAERTFCLPEHNLQYCIQEASPTIDISQIKRQLYKEVVGKAIHETGESTDVVMHIWDCGGQPIFLDILSAFLTSRTMFLLLFDGSIDLNILYHARGGTTVSRDRLMIYS